MPKMAPYPAVPLLDVNDFSTDLNDEENRYFRREAWENHEPGLIDQFDDRLDDYGSAM